MVFDDQDEFLAAFEAGELDRDFVAVVRFQGPRANGMPELHKLTPALGVLQDRGHRVALVTDGRMSGASGKVPAAIHLTPEAADGGPLARVRDGDIDPPRRRRRHARGCMVDPAEFAARPAADATATARSPAPAASCSQPSAARSARPTHGAERLRRGGRDESNLHALLDVAPVMPVVVSTTPTHAVPLARALVAGGLPVIELTLRTPAALDAIERIADEVPEILVGAGTIVDTRQADEAAAAGRAVPRQPGQHADVCWTRWTTPGCRTCPGTSTVSEMLACSNAGYTELKFFPAEAAGGAPYLASLSSPFPQVRFCPTGGITAAAAASTWRCRTSAASAAPG